MMEERKYFKETVEYKHIIKRLKWCEENTTDIFDLQIYSIEGAVSPNGKRIYMIKYSFINDIDTMAFKLRWL